MTYANRLSPMRELPAADAPMAQWLAPLSATLTTRRIAYFSTDPIPPKPTNPLGNYTRKRATVIDARRAIGLKAEGHSIDDIADALGVSTRSVDRALAAPKRSYRSLG